MNLGLDLNFVQIQTLMKPCPACGKQMDITGNRNYLSSSVLDEVRALCTNDLYSGTCCPVCKNYVKFEEIKKRFNDFEKEALNVINFVSVGFDYYP